VLDSPSGGRVALSAKCQGRSMTTAVDPAGQGFGWIDHDFLATSKTDTQFANYVGEDRFWRGSEGGRVGPYFPPGSPCRGDAEAGVRVVSR
jgi:hypothetical protein